MGHCSKKCISSSISSMHSLQIRSFNGIFWYLPFSISWKKHILNYVNIQLKLGKRQQIALLMGELGRYPLFLEVLLNMIKYWVRLSKINTSSTLLFHFHKEVWV
jgi:hypothetical protein